MNFSTLTEHRLSPRLICSSLTGIEKPNGVKEKLLADFIVGLYLVVLVEGSLSIDLPESSVR